MDKKRILIAKFGGSNGRISFGSVDKEGNIRRSKDITSGCTEAKTIIEILEKTGKFEIGVLTKILDKDYLPSKYEFYSTLKLGHEDMDAFFKEKKFDYMLIINGSINCFGGAEEAMIPDLCIYRMMHYFPGKIFYCQCDLAINMMFDVYEYISSKPWSSKYSKDEYDISGKDIIAITQANDLDKHLVEINKKKMYQFKRENLRNFHFEKYPTIMPFAHVEKNTSPIYDLGYGGTLRGGRRIKKLVKYYFGYPDEIKVNLYGKLNDPKLIDQAKKIYGNDVSMPDFGTTCNFVDNGKMLNKSLATIVIGDEIFERTQTVQQRAYQAMCANVVAFIDEDLDVNHDIFKHDDVLNRFMYVTSKDDVVEKIRTLKSDPKLVDYILSKQQEIISFDKDVWANELADIIMETT
jgi:hypothetical protein